jgi:hypothetical protein
MILLALEWPLTDKGWKGLSSFPCGRTYSNALDQLLDHFEPVA